MAARKRFGCWLKSKVDQAEQMHGTHCELRGLARESKSLRLIGFDIDPGKEMPNYQNTATQTSFTT